jgi:hypothetical protein
MKRRNAIMAALSILFLVLLLFTMVLALVSAPNALASLVFGGSAHDALVGMAFLSFPVFIFVMLTIILLIIEDSRATRMKGAHWWLRPTRANEPPSTIHVETHVEERDR